VVLVNGVAFFGLVVMFVFKGEVVGWLWDGVVLVVGMFGFYELKCSCS